MARKGIRATEVLATDEQFSARIRPGLMGFYNGQGSGGVYAIGLAHSLNGKEWVRDARNPVLEKGAAAAWDDDHVKDPAPVIVNHWVHLFYAGHDGTKYQIGLATSKDGGRTFTKYASNPVIAIGSGGAFDDTQVRFPVVVYDPDDVAAKRWKMWYCGEEATDQGDIGYAYSSDGKSWTKHGEVLSRGSAGAWDDYSIMPGTAVKVEGTWHLSYLGKDDAAGNWQSGLATFTDPEGAYTKSASNPVLARKSTRTQTLTADTLTGSKTVTVGDTSVFTEGEWVSLDDGDSDPTVTRIASIDSATQLTLRDAAEADYTTAQTAVVRSIYYGSVNISAVWREGDEWVASITCFQMTADLREVNGYATAASLTGAWEPDEERGIMLELERSTAWDGISAENLVPLPAQFNPAQDAARALRTYLDASGYPVLDLHATPPGVRVRRTTNQSITSGAQTAISWESASVGYGGLWALATNPTRVVITDPGVYLVTATVALAPNATGKRAISFRLNGGTTYIGAARENAPDGTSNTFIVATCTYQFAAGDYIELMVDQDSGGSLNVVADNQRAPQLSVWKVAGF